jgi:hypothetical protein
MQNKQDWIEHYAFTTEADRHLMAMVRASHTCGN